MGHVLHVMTLEKLFSHTLVSHLILKFTDLAYVIKQNTVNE